MLSSTAFQTRHRCDRDATRLCVGARGTISRDSGENVVTDDQLGGGIAGVHAIVYVTVVDTAAGN